MNTTNTLPPAFFLRFFRWYCNPQMQDYIEGDLMEVYGRRLKSSGKLKADIRFIIDVILLFRPGIIRPYGNQNFNNYGMFKSYLKIGWRNLLRNKGYSIINISGLAIGMCVAILNGLWIWDEFSYNRYFTNYDRIASAAETGLDLEEGGRWTGTTMTYPLSTGLAENYRQNFKRVVRVSWDADCILSIGEKKISVVGKYTSADFPDMFTLKMLRGTRGGLTNTHSILISQTVAQALFGEDDPINQTLRMNNKTDVTVTGVYEDFPVNTEFNSMRFFSTWSLFLAENKWIEERALTDLRNHFLRVYVEIPEGNSFELITSKVKNALQFDPADAERAVNEQREFTLYPMSRWHLYPTGFRSSQYEPVKMIMLVGAIGIFVLILACINFMNLSTARSEKRAKEVGIRKTIGSVRSQLINQFFSESFLVVLFSFVLALGLSSFFLPAFNAIASKEMTMPWTNLEFWLMSFIFIVLTSVLAGSYPALYLSSFNPIKALKGTFRVGPLASIPRKVLVVFQFSISVTLIIGTAIVYQQIQYAQNRPVGYDRAGLMMINKKSADFYGKYDVLRTELKNTGVVEEVSESMGPMTEVYSGNNGWDWEGRDPKTDESFATLAVSHMHGKTAGWQFIDGHDFDLANISDSSGLVINESAARMMHLEKPIGQWVRWTWWVDKRVLDYKIIGVVKDMVMDSPYEPVEPTMFYLKGFNGTPGWINVRVKANSSLSEAVPKIEAVFRKVIPSAPFEYEFADEEYSKKFASEERIGKLASVFSVLAIFISSLGLLGLASFVAEQRTKEIGIRKVMGASVTNLWKMLSVDFLVLVVIACLVATPLAYYWFNAWLQDFQYHTSISIWTLISTITGAVGITLLMVSYQAIKVAMAPPVNSLRSE
jgi:putative ABC transport system permease protein